MRGHRTRRCLAPDTVVPLPTAEFQWLETSRWSPDRVAVTTQATPVKTPLSGEKGRCTATPMAVPPSSQHRTCHPGEKHGGGTGQHPAVHTTTDSASTQHSLLGHCQRVTGHRRAVPPPRQGSATPTPPSQPCPAGHRHRGGGALMAAP